MATRIHPFDNLVNRIRQEGSSENLEWNQALPLLAKQSAEGSPSDIFFEPHKNKQTDTVFIKKNLFHA